ncbi:hypothetical protein MIMGU_mgv1a017640mg [Erythranthe guttata]|uniref:Uncharacterized protein n=1 Tax=Erythranthe guttata TaxID=4155 RepID=A0A022RD80_ERYGU|nr:hypothetical protein MIMGU_mgv1a017640mg [Erythranthe guttata]
MNVQSNNHVCFCFSPSHPAARGLSANKKANSPPKKSSKSPSKKEVKDGGKVSTFATSSGNLCTNIIGVGSNCCEEVGIFSGMAAFAISPLPSSLPLPTFSVRPKALITCCKAEAATGIDTGATDYLRRMNMHA